MSATPSPPTPPPAEPQEPPLADGGVRGAANIILDEGTRKTRSTVCTVTFLSQLTRIPWKSLNAERLKGFDFTINVWHCWMYWNDDTLRKIVYNILTFLLTITLILGVSIFTYGTFYFTYMPSQVGYTRTLSGDPGITSQVHDEEVNFQFRPCLKRPEVILRQ